MSVKVTLLQSQILRDSVSRKWKRKTAVVDRFWSKVEKADGCWLWTAYCGKWGYGSFCVGDSMVLAHRVSYELAYGPIPDGLDVLHRCDNPPCVRPEHLFLGTDLDNARDMDSKGRRRPSPGERNGNSKLSYEQVTEIRGLYAGGGWSWRKLARQFGVSHHQIGLIVRGRSW